MFTLLLLYHTHMSAHWLGFPSPPPALKRKTRFYAVLSLWIKDRNVVHYEIVANSQHMYTETYDFLLKRQLIPIKSPSRTFDCVHVAVTGNKPEFNCKNPNFVQHDLENQFRTLFAR